MLIKILKGIKIKKNRYFNVISNIFPKIKALIIPVIIQIIPKKAISGGETPKGTNIPLSKLPKATYEPKIRPKLAEIIKKFLFTLNSSKDSASSSS